MIFRLIRFIGTVIYLFNIFFANYFLILGIFCFIYMILAGFFSDSDILKASKEEIMLYFKIIICFIFLYPVQFYIQKQYYLLKYENISIIESFFSIIIFHIPYIIFSKIRTLNKILFKEQMNYYRFIMAYFSLNVFGFISYVFSIFLINNFGFSYLLIEKF